MGSDSEPACRRLRMAPGGQFHQIGFSATALTEADAWFGNLRRLTHRPTRRVSRRRNSTRSMFLVLVLGLFAGTAASIVTPLCRSCRAVNLPSSVPAMHGAFLRRCGP